MRPAPVERVRCRGRQKRVPAPQLAGLCREQCHGRATTFPPPAGHSPPYPSRPRWNIQGTRACTGGAGTGRVGALLLPRCTEAPPMRLPRFRVRTLMIAVAVVAIIAWPISLLGLARMYQQRANAYGSIALPVKRFARTRRCRPQNCRAASCGLCECAANMPTRPATPGSSYRQTPQSRGEQARRLR